MKRSILNLLLSRLAFPLLTLVFISAYYSSLTKISPKAGNYPKTIIAVVAVLLAWTFISEVRQWWKEASNQPEQKESGAGSAAAWLGKVKENRHSIYTVAAILIFLVIIPYLGFFASAGLFLISLFYLLGIRNHLLIWVLAASLVLVSFVVFKMWLSLPLPEGFLF